MASKSYPDISETDIPKYKYIFKFAPANLPQLTASHDSSTSNSIQTLISLRKNTTFVPSILFQELIKNKTTESQIYLFYSPFLYFGVEMSMSNKITKKPPARVGFTV